MIAKIFTAFCFITLAMELQSCQEAAAKSLNSPCPSPRVVKSADFFKNGCPKDLSQELLLPHEGSCKKYYICSYGQKLTMECPPGLHFSSALKVCDWPARSGCQDPTPIPDARSLQLPSPDQRCSTDWSVFTMFPDREDCAKFYMCANGVAMAMACDPGMHFNAVLMVCDWPSTAGCSIAPGASSRNSKSKNLNLEIAKPIAITNPAVATLVEPSPTIISIKTTNADVVTSENAETGVTPIICISIQPGSPKHGDAKSAKLNAQKSKTGKGIQIIKTCPEPNTEAKPIAARSQKFEVPSTASKPEETTPTKMITKTTIVDKNPVTESISTPTTTNTEITSTSTNAKTETVTQTANIETTPQITAQSSDTEATQPETTTPTTVTKQKDVTIATTGNDLKKRYKDLQTSTVQTTETTTETTSTLVTLSLDSDEVSTTTVTEEGTSTTDFKKTYKNLETSTIQSTEPTTETTSTLVTLSLNSDEVSTTTVTEEATSTTPQSTDKTTMESTISSFTTFASLDTGTTKAFTSETTLQNTESATDTSTITNPTEADIPLTTAAHKVGKSLAFPNEKTTEVTITTENGQTTEASTQNEELSSTTNSKSMTTEEATTEITSPATETLSTEVVGKQIKSEKAMSTANAEDITSTTIPSNTESITIEKGITSTILDTTMTESLFSRSGKELISTTDHNEQLSTTITEGIYSTTAESVENTTPINGIESTTLSICDNCTLSAKYWAEKTNCSGYWECEGGKQVLKFCPVGLRFNNELETCDFEENVKCN